MHSYREIVGKLIQLNALKRISTHRAASEIGLYDGQMPLLENAGARWLPHAKKRLLTGCMYRPPVWRYRSKRMQKCGIVDKNAFGGGFAL